ncbi:hypothetical protein KKC60_03545 [Patescibacteria group bacterium]|nr:hypothetical protein [Patescibacteria group bacterium]
MAIVVLITLTNTSHAQSFTIARFDLDRSLSLWLIHRTESGFFANVIVNTDKWVEVDAGWNFQLSFARKKASLSITTLVGTNVLLETGVPQSLVGTLLVFFDYSFISSQLWANYFLKFDRQAKDFLYTRLFFTIWNVGLQVELTYDTEKLEVYLGGTVGLKPLKNLFLKIFLGKSATSASWIIRFSGEYSF